MKYLEHDEVEGLDIGAAGD